MQDEITTIHLLFKNESSLAEASEAIELLSKNYNLTADAHKLTGKRRDLESAFGIQFYREGEYVHYKGRVTLPDYLEKHVLSVLGLSTKPAFQRIKARKPEAVVGTQNSYNPQDIANLYNFPTNAGAGQKIGIIELGGGYHLSTIQSYLQSVGTPSFPIISDSLVDGATNNPSDINDSGEVYLDIEIIAAIAYEASITVYFAPNTDIGFIDAINKAINDGNNAISISWAGSEDYYNYNVIQAYEQVLSQAASKGVVIFVSSGDAGATDGSYDGSFSVNYPSSSPYVVSCGGTSLASGTETAWNYGGGGFSIFFQTPVYQNSRPSSYQYQSQITGEISNLFPTTRGLPDVSANADPYSGYNIATDLGMMVVGGTSAVAPLYASLVALLNNARGKNINNILPLLYDPRNTGIQPVSSGGNGGFFASAQWNPCTGLGSPNGGAFLQYLNQYY